MLSNVHSFRHGSFSAGIPVAPRTTPQHYQLAAPPALSSQDLSSQRGRESLNRGGGRVLEVSSARSCRARAACTCSGARGAGCGRRIDRPDTPGRGARVPGLHNAGRAGRPTGARSRYRRARGACAARTFAAVALPDEAPQQVGAVVAVRGLVEGLLREGVGAMGRGRGLRHGGRAGRAGRARYSCRGAQGRAALSERLSRPTIAARLPPAPHARRARALPLRRPPPPPRRRRPALAPRAAPTPVLVPACSRWIDFISGDGISCFEIDLLRK